MFFLSSSSENLEKFLETNLLVKVDNEWMTEHKDPVTVCSAPYSNSVQKAMINVMHV